MTREKHLKALNPDTLLKELGPSIFSSNLVLREAVDSTNTLAKELAGQGAPEGTIVSAEEQTAGRGRMGRQWVSPSHANLTFSLLLRPGVRAEHVFMLTMILALSTIKAVEAVCGLSSMIKWPNDLYAGNKKLGGLLTEFSVTDRRVEHVVLGLGLNVNWNPGTDDSTQYPATSILKETGRSVSRERLLARILERFEYYYREVLEGKLNQFYEEWNARSMLLGRHVDIDTVDGTVSGKAVRIDYDGALIILDDNDREQKILNGDVSVKK